MQAKGNRHPRKKQIPLPVGKVPSKETSVIPPIEDLKNTLKYTIELVVIRTASSIHKLSKGEDIAPSLAKQLKDLRNLCKEHSTDTAQDTSSSSILLDIVIQLIGLNTTVNNLLQLEAPAAEIEEIKNVISNRTVLLTELVLQTKADDSSRIPLERYAAYAAAICLAEFIDRDQTSTADFAKTALAENYVQRYSTEARPLIERNIQNINELIGKFRSDVSLTKRSTVRHSQNTTVRPHKDGLTSIDDFIEFYRHISSYPSGNDNDETISSILIEPRSKVPETIEEKILVENKTRDRVHLFYLQELDESLHHLPAGLPSVIATASIVGSDGKAIEPILYDEATTQTAEITAANTSNENCKRRKTSS